MSGGGRSNARSVVIAGLAAGLTVVGIARQAGVGEATIRRWRRNPAFAKAVEDARCELIANTVGRLSDSATAAVKTLQELLSSAQPPSVRLGAARAILEMAVKYREAVELAERVKQIEATLAAWEAR